eukprot:728963-Alexandrium_andersonii.AAC.1
MRERGRHAQRNNALAGNVYLRAVQLLRARFFPPRGGARVRLNGMQYNPRDRASRAGRMRY